MKDIIKYEEKANAITITNPEELKEAASFLNELNVLKDRITKEKDKVMRPLLDAVAAERARWSPQEKKITTFITELRTKIAAYQTKAAQDAEKQKAKIGTKLDSGKISLTKAIEQSAKIEGPEESIETGAGTLKFRTVKKWRVKDLKKIPLMYLIPDDHQINQARKNDTPIPGIEYYEEQVPVSYRA